MNQKGRKSAWFSFAHDRRVSQSTLCHFLCISCTLFWSQCSLSRFPAVYFTSHLSLYTPQSLLLSLSLSVSFIPLSSCLSLYFTSSHLLIDLYPFQGFPSALLLPIAPLIPACCTADRRATSRALTLSSLAIALPHSLFLTHLCRSLSHIISLFTRSSTPTAAHMLLSYSTVCTRSKYTRCFKDYNNMHVFIVLTRYNVDLFII